MDMRGRSGLIGSACLKWQGIDLEKRGFSGGGRRLVIAYYVICKLCLQCFDLMT